VPGFDIDFVLFGGGAKSFYSPGEITLPVEVYSLLQGRN
jgi:hypothetical protein